MGVRAGGREGGRGGYTRILSKRKRNNVSQTMIPHLGKIRACGVSMQYSLVTSHYVWRLKRKGRKTEDDCIKKAPRAQAAENVPGRNSLESQPRQHLEFSSFREGMQN